MDNEHRIAEVIAAEHALSAAHLTMDLDAFEQLFHADYVILQPGGRVETKSDVLASLRSGTRHWQIAAVDELDVRLYGDTAIVIGRWRGKGTNGDNRFDYSARFSSVWLCGADGLWQNIVSQSTDIT